MRTSYLIIILSIIILLPGCGVVEAIFKAGMWVGILVVVGLLALIYWAVTKARK